MPPKANRFAFKRLDRGLDVNRATTEPGFALTARNLDMNRRGQVELRPGTMRVWNTRPANGVNLNLFEFVNAAGTTIRLTKIATVLYSFSLTASTALTSLETGLSSAGRADIVEALNLIFAADQKAKNYVSIGTSGANNTLTLDKAAPTSALSPTSAGTATGMTAGVYRVCYSFYNPTMDYETPPRAVESVTITVDQAIRCTMPSDPGDGFTTMRFYRTLVGELGPLYRVASGTTFSGTQDLIVVDSDITDNPSTYPLSDLHNDDGAIVAANPDACKFAEWHKHRLAFGSSSTSGSALRIYFSDLDRPAQFFVTTIAKDPAHYHDLDEGRGRVMTGLTSYNGALVCFKDYSITVRNGDVDPRSWQWYVAIDGDGCLAPWTRAVAPGIGIFYASARGVFLFNLSENVCLSDKPDGSGIGDDYRALDFTQVEEWWGIWDAERRQYLLGVTPTGATAPTRIYVYNFDTGAWTTREIGMANTEITAAGIVTNGDSVPKVYLGTSDGYALETNRATQADGPISGTITGTATAGAATTLTDSAAAFYTTNDGLTGLVITVRHSATSYESRIISSNTGTVVTVSSAWTTNPVSGERYFIGAIQATLTLAPVDAGDVGEKTWYRINGSWARQTHTVPIRIGFTLDDQTTPPTYTGDEETMGDVRFSVGVNDRAVECAPHLDLIGTSAPIELKSLEMDYGQMNTRNPAS